MFKDKSNKEIFEMAHAGDKEARDYLVTSNMRLVYKIAHNYTVNSGNTDDFETFVQEGCIGLIKAVDRFDVNKGFQFSTYAISSIKGQINLYLRDHKEDKPFRIKRADKTLYNKALRARDELQQKLLREPTLKEVSENIGMEIIEVERVLNCMDGYKSIYDIKYKSYDGTDIMQIETLENRNNLSEEQILNKMIIHDNIKKLKDKHEKVINLRYYKDLSQREIGEILNVSQVQVSRLEKAALNNLREMIM